MISSDEPSAAPAEPVGYFRGGVVVSDTRRIGRVLAASCFVVLALLIIALTVDGVRDNGRASTLQRHGVVVDAVVTGCLGIASGTGITVYEYQCRATFTAAGHQHNELIRGSRALLPTGSTQRAVVDPATPSSLSTVQAAQTKRAAWRAYVAPVILLAVLLVLAGGLRWRSRRVRPVTVADRVDMKG